MISLKKYRRFVALHGHWLLDMLMALAGVFGAAVLAAVLSMGLFGGVFV